MLFTSITQMEAHSWRSGNETAHCRLKYEGNQSVWLRVVYEGGGQHSYFIDQVGKMTRTIDRTEAVRMMHEKHV